MLYKKDFKAIAKMVRESNEQIIAQAGQVITKNNIANELADYFATQNPRFDRQKFLNACGLQAGK